MPAYHFYVLCNRVMSLLTFWTWTRTLRWSAIVLVILRLVEGEILPTVFLNMCIYCSIDWRNLFVSTNYFTLMCTHQVPLFWWPCIIMIMFKWNVLSSKSLIKIIEKHNYHLSKDFVKYFFYVFNCLSCTYFSRMEISCWQPTDVRQTQQGWN